MRSEAKFFLFSSQRVDEVVRFLFSCDLDAFLFFSLVAMRSGNVGAHRSPALHPPEEHGKYVFSLFSGIFWKEDFPPPLFLDVPEFPHPPILR